jgi:hypothetical protein
MSAASQAALQKKMVVGIAMLTIGNCVVDASEKKSTSWTLTRVRPMKARKPSSANQMVRALATICWMRSTVSLASAAAIADASGSGIHFAPRPRPRRGGGTSRARASSKKRENAYCSSSVQIWV